MAMYGMDVVLSPGGGVEKDVLSPVSREWRRGGSGVRTYDGRQRADMPPLIHHKVRISCLEVNLITILVLELAKRWHWNRTVMIFLHA